MRGGAEAWVEVRGDSSTAVLALREPWHSHRARAREEFSFLGLSIQHLAIKNTLEACCKLYTASLSSICQGHPRRM